MRTIFLPQREPVAQATFTTVKVATGEVGRTIRLDVSGSWDSKMVGQNGAAGTVTTVDVSAGESVDSGDALYSVDLNPVRVAVGAVPMFRDIGFGAKGVDVEQVQLMLAAQGYLIAPFETEVGPVTEGAIARWHVNMGQQPSTVLQREELIFVPQLPARVIVDAELISRGSSVSGGEPVVRALAEGPTFAMTVTEDQQQLVSPGNLVRVDAPSGPWTARLGAVTSTDEGQLRMSLEPDSDGPVCSEQCAQDVSATGSTVLQAQVTIVEPTQGLTVPAAAVMTQADGTFAVQDADGTAHQIEVVVSANGSTVIKGIDEGTTLRVPAVAQ